MLIRQAMTKRPVTVASNVSVSCALALMHEKNVHRLPVLDKRGRLVGIVTKTDLFKVFIDMLGGRRHGVRVYATVPSKKGTFAKIMQAVFKACGDVIGLGPRRAAGTSGKVWEKTIKVKDLPQTKLVTALKPVVNKFKDARST